MWFALEKVNRGVVADIPRFFGVFSWKRHKGTRTRGKLYLQVHPQKTAKNLMEHKTPQAKTVAKVLDPHFLKEEEYALPPLGRHLIISELNTLPEMEAAMNMTDRLKANLIRMLFENKQIVLALKALTEAARLEGKEEVSHFAEKLILHAQTEEEVLYPASILIGEYLKLKNLQKTGR